LYSIGRKKFIPLLGSGLVVVSTLEAKASN